jgi:hypothetical protein
LPDFVRLTSYDWASIFDPSTRPQGEQGKGSSKEGLVDIEAVDDQFSRCLRRAGAHRGSVMALRPDKFLLSVTSAEIKSVLRPPHADNGQ